MALKRRKKLYAGPYVLCSGCNYEVGVTADGSKSLRHDIDGNLIDECLLRTEAECPKSGKKFPDQARVTVPLLTTVYI